MLVLDHKSSQVYRLLKTYCFGID